MSAIHTQVAEVIDPQGNSMGWRWRIMVEEIVLVDRNTYWPDREKALADSRNWLMRQAAHRSPYAWETP